MRYKVAPGPVSYDLLLETRDALPLVPGSVDDCCARVTGRTAVSSREAATEWLTFLRALGLAAESERGYYRPDGTPDREALADAYRENVFGAREVEDAIGAADGPLDAAAVFEELRDSIPEWERNRHADWEREWHERVERLLSWGVEFGRFEEREDGYVPV